MYNLSTIRPLGFLHSSGFREVIDSLSWALSDIGHDVNVTENWLSTEEKDTNIIFGAELLHPSAALPKNSIIFNLEQPTHPLMEKVRTLAKGLRVWDYSASNVETWKSSGHDVRHVPIGFTPNLVRIPKAPAQDIDVLLYGFMTPRRGKIVQELSEAGLRVVATDKCYGGGRDNLISRTKVVLNVHADGRDLFEIVRVSYLLANSKCVVSEFSVDDDEYSDLHKGFIRVPIDQMVAKCKELVSNKRTYISDCRFVDMERVALDVIRSRDFVQTVRRTLGWNLKYTEIAPPVPPRDEWPEIKARGMAYGRFFEACKSGDMKDFMGWLREHARGDILEIGVRGGSSTSAFLAGLEDKSKPSAQNPAGIEAGHLTSIDIADCSHLFKGHPLWSFVQTDSKNLPLMNLGKFDLILIDGGHTRMDYKTDLDNAFSLVKPGGLIVSHDTDTVPGERFEDHPHSDYPSVAIREEYLSFCETRGLKHYDLPGKYGMGVIEIPKVHVQDSSESWQASEALLR